MFMDPGHGRVLCPIDRQLPVPQPVPSNQETRMYTRTVTVRVAPEKIDEVVALWRDEAVAAARRQPGCTGGQLLIDRASGKGISHFTWDTQAQANATGPDSEHLKQILARFAAYFVAPPIVEHWEVAAQG